MSQTPKSVWAILLVVLVFPGAVFAQPTGALPAAETTRFLHAGMTAARHQLRSGIFRASGNWTEAHDSGEVIKSSWEVYCAFDYDSDAFRFDQELQLPLALPEGVRPGKVPIRLATVKTKVAFSTDGAVYWCDDESGMVELWGDSFETNPRLKVFDVRSVGLLGVFSFGNRVSVDEICDIRSRLKVRDVTQHSGVQRILYEAVESKVLIALSIDESEGFTPIRTEIRDLAEVGSNPTFEQAEVVEDDSVTWKLIDGVQVPESMQLVAGTDRRELAFEWESVNKPIPDELFQKEGLGLPGETFVIDHRLGRGIVIGRLDGKPTAFSNEPPLSANRSRTWIGSAIIGLLLTIGLAGWIILKPNSGRSSG